MAKMTEEAEKQLTDLTENVVDHVIDIPHALQLEMVGNALRLAYVWGQLSVVTDDLKKLKKQLKKKGD